MSVDVIEGINPKILWQRFYEITQIPRPSKKEEKILEYLKNWSLEHKFSCKQDKAGNLAIFIPATKGMESYPIIVLQGHVDMVCEMNKGTNHDFNKDPLKLKREGDWIKAEGTTLGSDNGIGVAAGLAIAEDQDAKHGPLEILLTVDEETGLTGVNNLEPGFIKGKYLLNLDSEEDAIFYIGCAGGMDTVGTLKIKKENTAKGAASFDLMISGLKGGHSGSDINVGRANAVKIIARTLKALKSIDYSVAYISGGQLRNAIPREAEAVLLFDPSKENEVRTITDSICKNIVNEYNKSDGGLKITLKKSENEYSEVFTKEFTGNLINVILAMPHGVLEMSQDIPGLVETSTNLASIKTIENDIVIGTSQRSSIESSKEYVANSVKAVLELGQAQVKTGEGYPGWKPNLNSAILKLLSDVYKDLYKSEAAVMAIHAGLECGILGNKYPGLDMVSFGPTITNAHSPDEGVEIKSVEKFYELLKKVLENAGRLN
jgi:dipeptidase D